jgi:hypothetical protein
LRPGNCTTKLRKKLRKKSNLKILNTNNKVKNVDYLIEK